MSPSNHHEQPKYISSTGWLAFRIRVGICLAGVGLGLGSCRSGRATEARSLGTVRSGLTDKEATAQTAALFYNLRQVAKTNALFGHQDATRNGYGWSNEYQAPPVSAERSDVRDVTDAFPAVYGWDLKNIAGFYTGPAVAHEQTLLHDLTVAAYDRGGINTYSWHYNNPVSKVSVNWRDSPVEAVARILPGGSHYRVFTQSLGRIAAYARSLVGADGQLVPVIFRPFHEMDGDWFWWGKGHCTAQEYKQLYQFTVTYLRDSLQVHSFLYAWSPDRNFDTEQQFLERYPGDAYVDVVGMDNYGDLRTGVSPEVALRKIKVVLDYALQKNKVAALTETGLANVADAAWFTRRLLPVLQAQKPGLAYFMLWSNSTAMYWTPYKGHPAEHDFLEFTNNPFILLSNQMTKMYVLKQTRKSK